MDHVKILAIDDNADNLVVLKALLDETFPAAKFISALSGKKGIELCLTEKPDVILLDIVMPEMDGYEVCQILKANDRTKTIPVVMITAARTDKESRIKALEFGADAFLTKPLDESELVAQIRAMVRIKELEDLKLDEKERLKRLVKERTSQLNAELSERKRAEKALKQSEERFQLLFNEAPLGYQSLDFDGHFMEVNQQWLETLGFTREEVVGKWFGDFLSPEYKEGFRQRFPLFKAQGHIHSEFEMVHKNGSRLFIAFEGKIGYNPDGGFKQTHCILQDITHRKLAEDALTESEEKYSILFKNSPDSYLIISDGIFVECNNATEMMLRGDRNQIIGQTPDAISPEIQPDGKKSSDSAAEKIAWTFENGKNTFEWMHRRFDGSDLYVEVSLVPMILKGKLTLFTTWRDISARKSAEQALKESEAQFREFFEKAADAIFIAEIASGIIVDANEAACRLLQRPYDEIVGIHQSGLHPPVKEDYAKGTFKIHKELVKHNVLSHFIENTVVRADGIEVPVEILASEVEYHGKHCLMGTFRDITERKLSELKLIAAKEKAEESDRLKSAFLANMSHEIRTPLNSIIGFSELLFDPDFDADRQIEFAQMINTSGTNLLTIITDIMDLSKIEAGQIQVNKARFMVNKLISDIQKEYSYKAYEKGIDLRLDPASPAIETFLESDQNRIKQVLVNFVGNSIKFTAKGSIEIGFAIVEGFIQFHVIDTGIGIPKDFHESVFERFRQVDSSSNRKYGGNGLGLAISKSLVEMLDGRIWMESESGKGSVFYFTIPVQTPEVT